MRYLVVVMLLTGCAGPEMIRNFSDEDLCGTPEFLTTPEGRKAHRAEMKRRNIECAPAAGFAYPPPQQTIIVY